MNAEGDRGSILGSEETLDAPHPPLSRASFGHAPGLAFRRGNSTLSSGSSARGKAARDRKMASSPRSSCALLSQPGRRPCWRRRKVTAPVAARMPKPDALAEP